jgi:hypothetical protein
MCPSLCPSLSGRAEGLVEAEGWARFAQDRVLFIHLLLILNWLIMVSIALYIKMMNLIKID